MGIFLWVLAAMLVLVAGVLFVPICYRTQGQIGEATQIQAKAYWFLLRVCVVSDGKTTRLRFKIGPFPVSVPQKRRRPQAPEPPPPKIPWQEQAARFWRILTKIAPKTIMALLLRFLQKLVRRLKPKRLRIRGIVGLDDPAQTGLLMGLYEAVSGGTSLARAVDLRPDFERPVLEARWDVTGRFSVFGLLMPVLWLIWQRPVRRALAIMKEED